MGDVPARLTMWPALAILLTSVAAVVALIWLDERQRVSDGGFKLWLALLLTAIASLLVAGGTGFALTTLVDYARALCAD